MKVSCTILLLLIFGLCSAHNAKEAHFDITSSDNQIIVEAEFPWTIRNALLEFDHSLKDSVNQDVFIQSMKQYIKVHFHIVNHFGLEVDLTEIKKIEKNEHSHQVNYIFYFKKDSIHSIRNSLLFDQSAKHINYHKLTNRTNSINFKTSTKNNLYEPISNKNEVNWWIIFSIVFTLISIFILLKIQK